MPLPYAIKHGYHTAADSLFKRGAEVNFKDLYGRTSLMLAADSKSDKKGKKGKNGKKTMVLLLENGADPNSRDKGAKPFYHRHKWNQYGSQKP